MRIGRQTRGGWTGVVIDVSDGRRLYLARGISVIGIDWDRSRTLKGCIEVEERQRGARERAWRAHFETHGLLRGLLRLRQGVRSVRAYERHEARFAARRHERMMFYGR